jgi:two-component system nitrogen regulation response regulator NtrX
MVQAGEFREDLFYRLNVVTLQLPPLRERQSDIGPLAQAFLEEAAVEHSLGQRSFGPEAIKQLMAHTWPGNIRELKNLVERTAILSEDPVIDFIEDLPASGAAAPRGASAKPTTATPTEAPGEGVAEFTFSCGMAPWQEFHEAAGKSYLKHVLRKANGNVSEAARMLCLERAYLHRLMKKLGVQRDVVVLD